jgi:outer membrane protein assembly factor BamB
LWSFDGLAHHDLDVAPDGRIYVLTRKAHVDPRFHAEKPILEDFVTILDAGGRELESISLLDCFESSPHLSKDVFHAGDVFHTNSLQLLDGRFAPTLPAFAAGNVLVSLRNTDQLAVVDLRATTVAWELTGSWKQQHEPVLLDDGHLLVFDNKGRRERSSVLELDPASGEVAWSYAPKQRGEFYSASCGSAQRLANGNTLIVSSEQGRAFEVTRDGEIVWEFWSPHRLPEDPSLVATLFDVVRLPADFDTRWLGQ